MGENFPDEAKVMRKVHWKPAVVSGLRLFIRSLAGTCEGIEEQDALRKPFNLTKGFKTGAKVEIFGLKNNQHFNACIGTVFGYDEELERYEIVVDTESLMLRPDNLRLAIGAGAPVQEKIEALADGMAEYSARLEQDVHRIEQLLSKLDSAVPDLREQFKQRMPRQPVLPVSPGGGLFDPSLLAARKDERKSFAITAKA